MSLLSTNAQYRIFWRGILYRPTLGLLAYAGFLIFLLSFFHFINPYENYFEARGTIVTIYNLLRVMCVWYLFWIIMAPGWLLAQWLWPFGAGRPPSVALFFFAGAGLWHLLLLAIGLVGGYRWELAVTLVLPMAVISYWPMMAAVQRSVARITTLSWDKRIGLAAVIIAALLLLIAKGLYPGGGHDYYNHYFRYYNAVVETGNLGPNEVWYHYLYSKGLGLFFLSMLLTDPLAPQLVTFCFFCAAGLAMYRLLSTIAPKTLWPEAGVVLFLLFYVYTPGLGEYRAHGGWGEFEKFHELVCALVMGLIWLTAEYLSSTARQGQIWYFGLLMTVAAIVIVSYTMTVFMLVMLGLVCLVAIAKRQRWKAIGIAGLGLFAVTCLASMLLINYVAMGIFSDNAQILFRTWNLTNFQKLSDLAILPLFLIWQSGMRNWANSPMPNVFESGPLLFAYTRLDLVLPAVYAAMASTLVAFLVPMRRRLLSSFSEPASYVVLASLVAFIPVALATGRLQHISFFRYSSFILPIVICTCIVLLAPWSRGMLAPLWSGIAGRLLPVATCATCIYFAVQTTLSPPALSATLSRAVDFIGGQLSIDGAYGLSGRTSWGGIYPGARGAYSIAGPGTRVWSFHIHSYCMLPKCKMDSYTSVNMSPRYDRVLMGPPEEAREILKGAGVNYFLYSPELGILEPLLRSDLFSPSNIGDYLGIRWTDGKTFLLTWLGPGTTPLDETWLATYRSTVTQAPLVLDHQYWRNIFEKLDHAPRPLSVHDMPK